LLILNINWEPKKEKAGVLFNTVLAQNTTTFGESEGNFLPLFSSPNPNLHSLNATTAVISRISHGEYMKSGYFGVYRR
ncbi:MAG: hypothetical protein ACRD8Z_10085, partial [Nitrososphaeraceae archaeon]